MRITSPAFEHGGYIPMKYSCDGENMNPPLIISDAPEGTTSFVLIMDDPDAPMGTFTHWVEIFPGNTKEIPENYQKAGGWRIRNDAGKAGYFGPCPPGGQHTYRFKLYAVDLGWPSAIITPSRGNIESLMEGHVLAMAELDGEYARARS